MKNGLAEGQKKTKTVAQEGFVGEMKLIHLFLPRRKKKKKKDF